MTTNNTELEFIGRFLKLNPAVVVCLQEDLSKMKIQKSRANYIVNYGNTSNGGTHWVALKVYNSQACFFDSFGLPPDSDIESFVQGGTCKLGYSTFQIQNINSSLCGWFCVSFLKYVDTLIEKRRMSIWAASNAFINEFDKDTDLNAGILRGAKFFGGWLKNKMKQFPSSLYNVLHEKIVYD